MSKYHPLYERLRSEFDNSISVRFDQIETILEFMLPDTARQRPQWWANESAQTRHVQCKAWMDAGFQTRNFNLANETVEFVRT
jgi:hypothetical protein